jgi:hypothetical protein
MRSRKIKRMRRKISRKRWKRNSRMRRRKAENEKEED